MALSRRARMKYMCRVLGSSKSSSCLRRTRWIWTVKLLRRWSGRDLGGHLECCRPHRQRLCQRRALCSPMGHRVDTVLDMSEDGGVCPMGCGDTTVEPPIDMAGPVEFHSSEIFGSEDLGGGGEQVRELNGGALK